MIDELCVAGRIVEPFAQILEEHPHEHRANRHPNERQTVCRFRLAGDFGYVSCHAEPRPQMLYEIGNLRQAQAEDSACGGRCAAASSMKTPPRNGVSPGPSDKKLSAS